MNAHIEIAKEIKGISSDSRAMQPGFAYVAIRGAKFNGEVFIEDAIQRGATHVIVQTGVHIGSQNKAKIYYVENPRLTLSLLANSFYTPSPSQIIAVTGTNGKTSTANFFMQLAHFANKKSAAIGTLGLTSQDSLVNLEQFMQHSDLLTSPDAVTLNHMLQALAKDAFEYVGIEASSHGLNQYRLDGISFKAAGFTNLSRDHIDYHGTMDAYFSAKKRLFSELMQQGSDAVLNADAPEFQALSDICNNRQIKVISYGKNNSDIQIDFLQDGILKFNLFSKKLEVSCSLIGEFQAYNAACAVGLAMASGLSQHTVIHGISNLKAASGRLEKIEINKLYDIYIDFAHTPDALQRVLQELRKNCKKRLVVVFGCGGDRDQQKREMMGAIAHELADVIVITDDNPRGEKPEAIRRMILAGALNANEVPDRAEAIQYAISILQPEDCLLIAGKGHENYQLIGNQKLPFSDKDEVLRMHGQKYQL